MVEDKHLKDLKMLRTALVIDDEDFTCELISDFLELEGVKTYRAQSAEEGYNAFKAYNPDLILVDLHLGKIGGDYLIKQIRKESPLPYIIVITGDHHANESYLLAIGAEEVIYKPFQVDDFLEKVFNPFKKTAEERELHRLQVLSNMLKEENEKLRKDLAECLKSKQKSNFFQKGGIMDICRAVAHGMKGEFMHIGYSLREMRTPGTTLKEVYDESEMIERSFAYSQFLLQRLLNFLDIGSLKKESIDVVQLLEKVEALSKPRLSSNIQFTVHISPDVDKYSFSANFEQLLGVLLELIINASRILRDKGGFIHIEVHQEKNKIFISVKDNGPGISRKIRKKLLKQQVTSESGTGLGLYLSAKVIKALGGKLSLTTSVNIGTTFTIEFPLFQGK
jgi:K+-sensing histidine kinase KdpD